MEASSSRDRCKAAAAVVVRGCSSIGVLLGGEGEGRLDLTATLARLNRLALCCGVCAGEVWEFEFESVGQAE